MVSSSIASMSMMSVWQLAPSALGWRVNSSWNGIEATWRCLEFRVKIRNQPTMPRWMSSIAVEVSSSANGLMPSKAWEVNRDRNAASVGAWSRLKRIAWATAGSTPPGTRPSGPTSPG
jgi:hypothetical protein